MIFVDTNVWMYAVGRAHPLRDPAREFLEDAIRDAHVRLCTSAEVLQEMLHAYAPVRRRRPLDAALSLARELSTEVWDVEPADVLLARASLDRYPGLGARDLLHVASCQRRGITRIKTYDRSLAAIQI